MLTACFSVMIQLLLLLIRIAIKLRLSIPLVYLVLMLTAFRPWYLSLIHISFGNGKCSLLHVQIFPEQGQQFSPAQAAGQFQIERCKHAALLRFVQIWPDQFFRQHFHFFSHRFRGFAVCCRIAQNELFCDGLIETFPQDSEDTLHNAWAERRFFQRNVAVVVISAVLAHLVDRALNLNCLLYTSAGCGHHRSNDRPGSGVTQSIAGALPKRQRAPFLVKKY